MQVESITISTYSSVYTHCCVPLDIIFLFIFFIFLGFLVSKVEQKNMDQSPIFGVSMVPNEALVAVQVLLAEASGKIGRSHI